uniref:VWFA domain-containing protein n=1 Tax=Mola mola TaxID=94237 RepID=A0A3Q3X7G8_MOLML
ERKDEADFFFLIDDSGSIDNEDFYDMKKFINEFLHTFRIGPQYIRMGLAKYADLPSLEFDLTTHTDAKSIEEAVEKVTHEGGGTMTGAALSFMKAYFNRSMVSRGHRVPEYLIVITDGKSADNVKTPAEELRAQGATIYAVGVKNASSTELLQIAGDPKRTVFVGNFDALKSINKGIITDICTSDGKENELQPVRSLSQHQTLVPEKALRENILRFLCSVSAACEDVQTDIIFLTSIFERIPAKEYQTMKDFMKSVIHKSTIGRNKVHFGVMQFSNDQQRVLPLNRHYSKEDMSKAIDEMQQVNKSTHTGKAITEATKYFEAIQGGRPDLRQSLIVITDGKAEDYIVRPAAALRAKGVVIYAIGVLDANPAQLLEITNSPDSVFNARNFDALKDLENRVILKHRRQIICTCASYFILHSHSTWDFKVIACNYQTII